MNIKKTSKFLSLILRHKPETVGIELDSNGWVDVQVLLKALNTAGHELSEKQLEIVVSDNDKQRFILSEGRIRANQGHSLKVELGLDPIVPPEVLFHGTATRFLKGIESEGLKKMNRQHVHLSLDRGTATKVGTRHGKPVVFEVLSQAMYETGFEFFLSENGVWLVDEVPYQYLSELPHNA